MKQFSRNLILGLSAVSLISLMACTGNGLPTSLPSGLSSSLPGLVKASASPSASPAATPATSPSANPSTPSSEPTPAASAEPGNGVIKVEGEDLFNKYTVNYRVGMKWVYSLKMPGIALPNLSGLAGFSAQQIPDVNAILNGLSGGSSGSTGSSTPAAPSEMGEFTIEVTAVAGDMVTLSTQVKMTTEIPGGAPIKPSTSSFNKSNPGKMYSELGQNGNTNGTLKYSLVGPESVTVPAGSFSADKIAGMMNVTSSTGAGSVESTQESSLWMAVGTGMVKQENKSTTSGITVTTLLELKSFMP
ncbi:hypothetical protein COW36_09695 [bacterium (Candidatus Blackallbacteria) CG17_big_fil_post_rev_8_21_14_2_50_48_46]|uniref:DUF3108 domain-containing protein n=1 Tax=bacterium (Candidatus Blackallbacteria) CG17_big_fil_post_rev_8_21_14_2_50_48_46 TaxID=2014261 RepID=A0A2M7G5G4_9BACT|nr:MAG: hypothetical protein COW64_01715 [bacterium (Candidatus Blackallbacteria) CG18_big_fil_WC_8_21_14_2_50_49_26]PIW17234.1 MAG: hypothetical protein COW36_09695 [bacterium (Candidatus Blackallbacteria) CG17_big_fil_post_rev_8_21_14_2_50_48_46]PIW51025.1 MAG: hypothetical protein COW20_00705 [bacterium (Candidatus Blackallbacteria) CG13_big_fil_rev_8_21_14_2_50_49_14]